MIYFFRCIFLWAPLTAFATTYVDLKNDTDSRINVTYECESEGDSVTKTYELKIGENIRCEDCYDKGSGFSFITIKRVQELPVSDPILIDEIIKVTESIYLPKVLAKEISAFSPSFDDVVDNEFGFMQPESRSLLGRRNRDFVVTLIFSIENNKFKVNRTRLTPIDLYT